MALWRRVDERRAVFTADETGLWPPGTLEILTGLGVLAEAAPATAVVCDACGADHVARVVFVESPPGSGLRPFIGCPEAGRVSVPLPRLKQWAVDFWRLARHVAAALDAAGDVEEIVSSRLWLLGKRALSALPREVFLARGLTWPDASAVTSTARLASSARPVVVVAGSIPASDIWAGRPTLVAPLASVVSFDRGQIIIDWDHLESAASPERRAQYRTVESFPTPAGAIWEDVRLTLSDLSLRVDVLAVSREFSFLQAGFEDRKKKEAPDRLWRLLHVFAACGGVVPYDSPRLGSAERGRLKQYVSQLGKRLQALLGVEGGPFRAARKQREYRARFSIASQDGLRFPTPCGATWDCVSVAEVRSGVVAIFVDAQEASASYVSDDEGRRDWEAVEQQGVVRREYDLRALGLTAADGRPNDIGKALLDVLRSGGKLHRPANDPALLGLGKRLSKLMQIDGAPFQYSKTTSVWSAVFEAHSNSADGLR